MLCTKKTALSVLSLCAVASCSGREEPTTGVVFIVGQTNSLRVCGQVEFFPWVAEEPPPVGMDAVHMVLASQATCAPDFGIDCNRPHAYADAIVESPGPGLYRVKRIVHTQKDIPPSCDLPAPIIDLVPPESYWKSL